jgi:glycosyltransferase involved in cell wall biosynthesis
MKCAHEEDLGLQDAATAGPRVLMVTGRADIGGGPEHVFQLTLQLTRGIAEMAMVHIACPREEPYWSRYEALLGAERMVEIPHRRVGTATVSKLIQFIRERGIEIVHAHGRAAGILARPAALLAGVRCFHTPHGGTPVSDAKSALYAVVEYALSPVTGGIIAVSESEAEALRPICAMPRRVNVIPNGVEIPDAPGTIEHRLTGRLRVVHVTRFVYQKNSELLLEIAEALREIGRAEAFEFVILGDGPGRAEFEAAVMKRGLRGCIRVLGAVKNPARYFEDAFSIVSTSRWEGLPLALLEAMARGVPAIATDVAGNRDAVADGESGYLFAPGAPRAAAVRLAELAAEPQRWRRMVSAARLRAEEEFSVRAMAAATLQLYLRGRRTVQRASRKARAAKAGIFELAGSIQGAHEA